MLWIPNKVNIYVTSVDLWDWAMSWCDTDIVTPHSILSIPPTLKDFVILVGQ